MWYTGRDMSPRRKGVDETDAPEGAEPAGTAPKKKRVTRKKAAPKPEAPEASVAISPMPAKPVPAAPVAPPPSLRPVSSAAPTRITIEPDLTHQEAPSAGGEEEPEETWTAPRKQDPDLSVPPRVLLQSKRPARPPVEDILEDVDDDGRDDPHAFVRPPVKSGLFRKIALGFGLLVVVLALLVGYVTYARATIIVHPKRAEVRTERVLSVVAEPSGADEVPGAVDEIVVSGEKVGAPTGSTETDAVATGYATLINTTGNDQTLVATTRLLTAEGVLFRLKNRVVVPARGRIKTEVYADKPGKASEIGPSKFTIPGLSAELQSVIYAESDAPMTGGTIASGVVSEEDIARIEAELKAELSDQARRELESRAGAKLWDGYALVTETMSRFVNVAPGESTADGIQVRLTLRVRRVGFDRAKAVAAAVEDLKRGLTSDRELLAAGADGAEVEIERADAEAGTAMIRVALRGESVVSIDSPLFDAEKLRGLSLSGVKTYFDAIEGIERVDVKFRPFWLKRMPDLKDHITFEIAK